MGVARDSPRSYITRAVEELNDINSVLSSDPEYLPEDTTQRIKKKKLKKPSYRRIYECRKSNDAFLKELSNELGIDTDLQDLLPTHHSPLSKLFSNAENMKVWLVFVNSTEEEQNKCLEPCPNKDEVSRRYKKISKSLRSDLHKVPLTDVQKYEAEIYSSLSSLGSDGVVIWCPKSKLERAAVTAVSQYGRLRTISHLPVSVIEIEWRHGKFKKPKILLSDLLSAQKGGEL